MKGAVSTIILVVIALVVVAAVLSSYYNPGEKSATTGRAVISKSANDRLGFQEQCNPNRDMCDVGLICKLGRDNAYRCLKIE
ncbi:MAG: hypothetical protein HY361_05100 [Candidatus Aenigmarchaeota archaeon]|nr:hypothetical protein [Candidatus Aenigmarchaeota archaeon]